MANIRIKDLSTTASTTASDDFFGVDGATNGTRKLNAYSPTFGGNLTVSGGTHTFGTANGGTYITTPGTAASTGTLFIQGGNASGSTAGGGVVLYGGSHASAPGWVRVGLAGTSKFAVNTSGLGSGTDVFTVDQAGNLTVSGGQIALAASSSTPSVLITQTDSAQYSIVRLQNTGGTAQSYEFGVGGSGTGSLAQKFYIFDNTAFATRVAIAPTTGNFLIGTTTDGGQKLQVNGTAIVSSTTSSTSNTTGALVVSGGVGVAGALYMGGTLYQGLGTSGNVVSGEGLMSASSTRSMVQLDTYHASSGGFMMMRRARGSFASPTAVQSGDLIGRLIGRGYGATAFFAQNCAQISMTAAENFSDVTAGSYISFETSATGQSSTSAPVEALRISAATSSTVAGATIVYGDLQLAKTVTATGTTGAQTINKSSGRVNFAASATSLVVTNSLCTTDSIITISKATNNSTARLGAVVAAAGSFTIYMDVAPDAECAVNFHLTN